MNGRVLLLAAVVLLAAAPASATPRPTGSMCVPDYSSSRPVNVCYLPTEGTPPGQAEVPVSEPGLGSTRVCLVGGLCVDAPKPTVQPGDPILVPVPGTPGEPILWVEVLDDGHTIRPDLVGKAETLVGIFSPCLDLPLDEQPACIVGKVHLPPGSGGSGG